MKLAVISDIHDNLLNLQKCLEWCRGNGVKEIICLGDLTNAETLDELAKNFIGAIHLIRGNMEIYEEDEVKKHANIDYLGRYGITQIGNTKIGVCHEPKFIKLVLGLDPMLDYVFYGHTHKPWIDKQEGVAMVNPGTLGGVFQKATFAVWDSESGELKLMLLEEL